MFFSHFLYFYDEKIGFFLFSWNFMFLITAIMDQSIFSFYICIFKISNQAINATQSNQTYTASTWITLTYNQE